jgi:hypothetical protein
MLLGFSLFTEVGSRKPSPQEVYIGKPSSYALNRFFKRNLIFTQINDEKVFQSAPPSSTYRKERQSWGSRRKPLQ